MSKKLSILYLIQSFPFSAEEVRDAYRMLGKRLDPAQDKLEALHRVMGKALVYSTSIKKQVKLLYPKK